MESENATTNNDNESIEFGSNKNSISSSTSSDFSLEDLQVLDSNLDKPCLTLEADDHIAAKQDGNNNENLSDPETIPSHAKKVFAGPGNWSMASNESLFSIRMDGASFCHLDSFSPLFDLPYDNQFADGKILETDEENNQGSSFLDEPMYEDDKGNRLSATSSSSSSSNSLVFPILSGERENGGSPYPRGSLIGPVPLSPPQPEPAPEPRSQPKALEAEVEVKETNTFIAWTVWFPCFRYCACCS